MTRIFTRNALRALAAIAVLGLAPAVAAAQTPGRSADASQPPAKTRPLQPHTAKSGHPTRGARKNGDHRWQVAERGDDRAPGRQGFHDNDRRGGPRHDQRSDKNGGGYRRG